MLYLLVSFALVVMVGVWLMDEQNAVAGASAAKEPSADWLSLWALVLLAWGTAFIVRPRWLCILLALLIVALGSIIVAAGLLGTLLDAGFRPWEKSAGPAMAGLGGLMLASRLATIVVWWRTSTKSEPA